MATTWIKPIHINQGKTIAQTITQRTDYAKDPEKTEAGQLVTGYECDPRTAATEFLLSKQEYERTTGRQRGKDDILLYHIRQSFKPDEIDTEKAHRIGRELALKLTKGNHAFIVSTHTDKDHLHNHILLNAIDLTATKKFRNPIRSHQIIQRISDQLCLENGLSIIETSKQAQEHSSQTGAKHYRQWQKENHQTKPLTARQKLERLIDQVLEQQPKDFDEWIHLLEAKGCEFKQSRNSVRLKDQKGFIRLNSLSEHYQVHAIQQRIVRASPLDEKAKTAPHPHASDSEHQTKGGGDKIRLSEMLHAPNSVQNELIRMLNSGAKRGSSVKLPQLNLLMQVQEAIQAQSHPHVLKEAAKAFLFLQDHNLTELDQLKEAAQHAKDQFNGIGERIKKINTRLSDITQLQKHIGSYVKTREIYAQYQRSGFNQSFYEKNQTAIEKCQAAKQFFDGQGMRALPKMSDLKKEFATLTVERKTCYGEYTQARKEMLAILKAKQQVEQLLNQHTDREREPSQTK